MEKIRKEEPRSSQWMSKINDDLSITSLSIPGSNDSASFASPDLLNKFTPFLWKAQSETIEGQLVQGIRYFDFELKFELNKEIRVCRGDVNLGSFKKAISPILSFLKEYPSEFIFLMLHKYCGGPNPIISGKYVMQEIKELSEQKTDIIYSNGDIPFDQQMPTVGELRGKIFLIEGFTGISSEIHKKMTLSGCFKIPIHSKNKISSDFKTYEVQNFDEGPEDQKKEATLNIINNGKENVLKVNFLTEKLMPKTNSLKYNEWFEEVLGRDEVKNVGIIAMNFPQQSLINKIIDSNY